MANSRYYSSIALPTTLTGSINNSVTTIAVASTSGFPGSLPYTLSIDYGSAGEELVEVTGVSLLSLTVTRGIDGTSAQSHNVGAVVRHVSSARDFTDSRTHEASTENVHGLSGVGNDFVGTTSTQTLTNKTLTMATGSLHNVDIFNTGGFVASVIGDSANPNTTRLNVLDNEISLNEMWAIVSNGSMVTRKQTGDTDASYRIRYLDTDGTTNRFALLAGGTINIAPNASTTFVPLDITAPDTTTTKRAIRIAASGGGTERFTVWNDGHVDIVGQDNSIALVDITHALNPTASYLRILSNGGTLLVDVNNLGTLDARYNLVARAVNGGSNVPLAVRANTTSQTADLTQWYDSGGSLVANIQPDGYAVFQPQANSTLSNVTAASGFSAVSFNARRSAGVLTVSVTVQRTGSTITADSAGNIPDTLACTLAAGFRPASGLTYVGSYDKGGTADGSISLADDGTCTLKTLSPTATIAAGSNVTFNFTFVP